MWEFGCLSLTLHEVLCIVDERKMSPCLKCGKCCKYIFTDWNAQVLDKNVQDREFLATNFKRESVLKGMIENPWMILVTLLWIFKCRNYKSIYRYRCLKLKGNLCSIHGQKKNICDGFPKYHNDGSRWKMLLVWNGCGYRKL